MKKKVLLEENKNLKREVQFLSDNISHNQHNIISTQEEKIGELLRRCSVLRGENVRLTKRFYEKDTSNDIVKVFYNEKKRATVVLFKDNTKFIVKAAKGVKTDIYSAVAYATVEKLYGSNSAFKRKVDKCREKEGK